MKPLLAGATQPEQNAVLEEVVVVEAVLVVGATLVPPPPPPEQAAVNAQLSAAANRVALEISIGLMSPPY